MARPYKNIIMCKSNTKNGCRQPKTLHNTLLLKDETKPGVLISMRKYCLSKATEIVIYVNKTIQQYCRTTAWYWYNFVQCLHIDIPYAYINVYSKICRYVWIHFTYYKYRKSTFSLNILYLQPVVVLWISADRINVRKMHLHSHKMHNLLKNKHSIFAKIPLFNLFFIYLITFLY